MKMTPDQVIGVIANVRRYTAKQPGETAKGVLDWIAAADETLLALQERLLEDYGADGPQRVPFVQCGVK